MWCSSKVPHHASGLCESQARVSPGTAASDRDMQPQQRRPMKDRSVIRQYDEAWKRLFLQAVPAEAIVQPAAQDLRVIIIGRATSREIRPVRRRLAKIGIEVFQAERPLLAGGVFDAATHGPAGP